MPNNYANITKLPKSFWTRLGQSAIQWIRADAKEGYFQNDSSDTYRSEEYKKRKRNDMRKKDGKRITSYATSISSNQTSFVDMTLTGKLLREMKVMASDAWSVTLGWISSKENIGKILGNERYGRFLRGLSKENTEKARQMILQQFDENIRKELKDIKINVRF